MSTTPPSDSSGPDGGTPADSLDGAAAGAAEGPPAGVTVTDPPADTTPATDGALGKRRPGPLAVVMAVLLAALAALTVLTVAARPSDDGETVIPVDQALGSIDVSKPVPEGTRPVGVGDEAPDVQLAYLDGGVQRLSELRGTPVVLNFWSSTCAPCLQEMPAFQEVHEDLGDSVTFVGVDVTDTREAGKEMVERTGVKYRNARDPRSEILAAFGGTVLPRTVLLDADGTVVATHSGALDREDLTRLLTDNGLVDDA